MDLKLYTAIVTNNEDKDKQGKIQVRILPEMEGVVEGDLPWALPFITDVSNKNTMSYKSISNDSAVWVFANIQLKRFYYINNRYFPKLFKFDNVKKLLNKIKGGSLNKDYKYVDFKLFEDGALLFHNNKDGSSGFINKNGTYSFFDEKGNVITYTKTYKIVDSNGNSVFEVTT